MTTTQRATIAIAAIVLILAPQLNRAELAAEPGKRMRFTGRWVESTLHDLNPDFESRWTRSGGKVGALGTGMNLLREPSGDGRLESFWYWDRYNSGRKQVWISIIVGNHGSEPVSGTVTLKLTGPGKATITRPVTLQPRQIQMISAEVTLPNKAGIYKITGKLKVPAKGPKKAQSAFVVASTYD